MHADCPWTNPTHCVCVRARRGPYASPPDACPTRTWTADVRRAIDDGRIVWDPARQDYVAPDRQSAKGAPADERSRP